MSQIKKRKRRVPSAELPNQEPLQAGSELVGVQPVEIARVSAKPINSEDSPEQGILSILHYFMSCVDFNKFSKDRIDELIHSHCSMSSTPELRHFSFSMMDLKLCSACKASNYEIVTGCNHTFCHHCYSTLIYNVTNGQMCLNEEELEFYKLSCPTCKGLLTLTDLSKATQVDWKQAAVTCSQLGPMQPACSDCKSSAKYSNISTCKHECDDCLYASIRRGAVSCSECGEAYESLDILKSRTTLCKGCNRSVYLIADYTFQICDGHRLCFSCLQTSYNEQQCIGCSRPLDNITRLNVEKTIFTTCELCMTNVESFYFIQKRCCKKRVCAFCQFEHGNRTCLDCGARLSLAAKEFLSELSQDLKDLSRTEPGFFN